MWVVEVVVTWTMVSLVTTPLIGYFLSENSRLPKAMLLAFRPSELLVNRARGEVLPGDHCRELINTGVLRFPRDIIGWD